MYDYIITFFETNGLAAPYSSYAIAALVFLLSLLFLRIFKFIILGHLKNLSRKTKTNLDTMIIESIDKIGWFFYVSLSAYLALQFIVLSERASMILNYTVLVLVTYYLVVFLQTVIGVFEHRIIEKRRRLGDEDTGLVQVLGRAIKWSLWIVAAVTILANLGYNVAGIIAGLGIGGLAIAIALQGVLTDIFAAFSIYFDKPFKKGDFIIIGSDMGVVKHIGIKSTRIQTLQGQELIVSNKDLTDTRVNNFGLMEKRRVVFNIGVTYQTSSAKLKKIPLIVKDIFEKIELADLDRAHFVKFGASSLDYEIVYYVNSKDYTVYMDIQQTVNLSMVERFAKEKIEFAYPTQTIFLEK